MTDAELLSQFRDQHSAEAFAELMGRHSGWVYALARRRVVDEHLASDVTQAVFILLAERARQIRDPSRLAAWIQRTTVFASNHAIRDRHRVRVRERASANQHPESDSTVDPASVIIRRSEIEAVEDTVARLSAADRSLIIHRFYRGQSLAEVGAELGLSADAVRKRIDRALERMKLRLTARGISGNASAGILAGLSSLNKIGPLDAGGIVSPSRAAATSRAVSIAKGVTQMQVINRIKTASAAVVIVLTLGVGIMLACEANHPSTTKPAEAAKTDSSPTARFIQAKNLIIVISADRTKITGFSNLSGKSGAVSVQNAAIDHVIVDEDVAAYCDNGHLYAFSAETGAWGTVDLPKPFDPSVVATPVVSQEVAAVAIPGFVYAFSAQTGTWDTLKVPSGEKVHPAVSPTVVTAHAEDKFYIFGTNGKRSDGL
jgi:RNA polymerase sigma factor (sigma-70 family)